MTQFAQNLISIQYEISDLQFITLALLTNVNDSKDEKKKSVIAEMLDKEYNPSLDWLYSTLYGQQSERVFKLNRIFVCGPLDITIVFIN